ncbi:hypothetical protein ACOMD4_37565 [Streptomyces anulatus]|uniref:hypothetical protein n=1 Tax=Streptomyces anulatus TaxID=1892 RepID=UPI003B7B38C5
MPPSPADEARAQLRALAAEASARRDERHEAVEAEFWQFVDQLQRSYHGAQSDIADALGVKRNQILRQTKRYRAAKTPPPKQ